MDVDESRMDESRMDGLTMETIRGGLKKKESASRAAGRRPTV
jgi:hypothetical protein